MHLQALRYLVAVVEEGHFGRAATRMHVSQPSVSQAVSRLEEQFGTQLLDRSGGRIVPTEAGERVLEEVRATLRHLDRAMQAATATGTVSRLRIGCKPFFSMWVSVEVLTPFRMAHPEAEVSVAELDVPAQIRALLAGEIDLVVGEQLVPHPGLRGAIIRDDPCAIWMSTDHALTQLDEVPLSRLVGVPIADGDQRLHPGYHRWIRAVFDDAGLAPTFAAPAPDSPTAISRIIDGTMVSVSADIMPEGAIAGIAVRRVSDPVRWQWAVTMPRDAPTESGIAFTAWARRLGGCADG